MMISANTCATSTKGPAINCPRPVSADVVLTVTAATIFGVTVGVLLAEAMAGVAVGAGTAVAFHFVLRSITPRR
ncbi:hypothetical protein [Rhodococcus sp. 27YEA6]|uniref:hypothetical protein n=1 Tax=Rhodococcus sp. 27YEA6 TaxID=3156273 RepID=UPI003836B5B3